MSADQPQKLNGVRGTVERGVYAAGSKSEHAAFFLVTDGRRYLLRRKGAPPSTLQRPRTRQVGKSAGHV